MLSVLDLLCDQVLSSQYHPSQRPKTFQCLVNETVYSINNLLCLRRWMPGFIHSDKRTTAIDLPISRTKLELDTQSLVYNEPSCQ